jgi:hypothetical protein
VHGTTLSVRDTLAAAEKLTNDGLDGTTTHHSETVATVSGNNLVHAGDGVLNSDSDGFLSGRQMAETPDLLLLVQTIGGHLHTSAKRTSSQSTASSKTSAILLIVPHRDHVVVHLLELLLGGLESVRGWVELVSLEALIGETDSEQLIILLLKRKHRHQQLKLRDPRGEVFQIFRIGLNKPAAPGSRRWRKRRRW